MGLMVTFTPKGLILPNPPTILIENLCPDPLFRDATWTPQGSSGVLTEVLAGGPNGNGYLEYAMSTANTTSPMQVTLSTLTGVSAIPCVPGETYNLSVWAYRSMPDGALTQRFAVVWYNAAGGTVSTTNTGSVVTVQNDFVRVNIDVVPPPLAVFMRVNFIWSGIYPIGGVLRLADGQITKGAGVKPFATRIVTDDDGDPVDIGQINANLDRMSLLGVGARPVLSSEHPAVGSIDDMPGTIIFETDNNGILVRRKGSTFASNNLDGNYRSAAPGNWAEWNSGNPFSGWLSGDNNRKHIRVTMLGRLIFVHIEFRIGSGGSIIGGTILPAQLPTNRDVSVEGDFGGDAITAGPWPVGHAVANIGNALYTGRILLVNGQPVVRNVPNSNTAIGSAWGTTVPAAWAPGDGACFDFMYWSS